jgi:hypothetical protein
MTVNFVGKRNYSADEVKAVVADQIEHVTGWVYGAENETQLKLRVFIEHNDAVVGLRPERPPLAQSPVQASARCGIAETFGGGRHVVSG